MEQLQSLVDHLLDTWVSAQGQILIFCGPRSTVETVSEELNIPGFKRAAGKGQEEQEEDEAMRDKRRQYMAGDIKVAVSTSLLAVGVDIQHLEVIIHLGMPNDLGDYLQEVGRCGRSPASSAKALSILMMCDSRMPTSDWHDRGHEALDKFVAYTVNCRRTPLAKFNDDLSVCCESLGGVACDICLVNAGQPVPWYPIPHDLRRRPLYIEPHPSVEIIEVVTAGAETKEEYLDEVEPPLPIDIMPAYPAPPSSTSPTSLADQTTNALRVLYERALIRQQEYKQRNRVEQSVHRWVMRAAQAKCAGMISPIAKECVVCYGASHLPNARTRNTNHREGPDCADIDKSIFEKLRMPVFRRLLKAAIKKTTGHCTSCLVPYEPFPSTLHGEPNERGGCIITPSRPTDLSDSDAHHILLYALLNNEYADRRVSRDVMRIEDTVQLLATIGVSGCLVAAELVGWLRSIPELQT